LEEHPEELESLVSILNSPEINVEKWYAEKLEEIGRKKNISIVVISENQINQLPIQKNPADLRESKHKIISTTSGEVIANAQENLERQRKISIQYLRSREIHMLREEVENKKPLIPSETEIREQNLRHIAHITNRKSDALEKPLEVYLTYLRWAFNEGKTDLVALPHEVINHEVINIEKLNIQQIQTLIRAVRIYLNKNEEALEKLQIILEEKFKQEPKTSETLRKLWNAYLAGEIRIEYLWKWLKENNVELPNDVPFEEILKFILQHKDSIGSRGDKDASKLLLEDLFILIPSKRINIVGMESKKTSHIANIFAERNFVNEEIELVDADSIYRTYMMWLKQKVDKFGRSIFDSEEDILTHLKTANITVCKGTIYLNGKAINQNQLYNEEISNLLLEITQDKPKVKRFLQEQVYRIVENIPSSVWVIVTNEYYPQARLNIFLTASDRIRENESIELLFHHPGIFIFIHTSKKPEEKILNELKAKFDEKNKEQEMFLRERLEVLEKFIEEQDNVAVAILNGGIRGGLHPQVERKLIQRLEKDFAVIQSQPHYLTAEQVITVWFDLFKILIERISGKELSAYEKEEGLNLLRRKDGFGFKIWLNGLKTSPEIEMLRFAFAYLSGNIRVVFITTKFNSNDRLRDKLIKLAQERGNISQILEYVGINLEEVSAQDIFSLLIGGEDNVFESASETLQGIVRKELKEGELKFVLEETKKLGFSVSNLGNIVKGIHIPLFNRLVREMFILSKLDLETALFMIMFQEVRDFEQRRQLREFYIPEGKSNIAVESLYRLIEKMSDQINRNAVSKIYQELQEIVNSGINAVIGLENLVRNVGILELIPELEELINIVYPGEVHGRVSMFEHSINALRSMLFIEEASYTVGDNEIIDYRKFSKIFKQFKNLIPSLEDLGESEFLEVIKIYKKATELNLLTQDRQKDFKLFLYLCILLHDIGKSVCVSQHYTLAKIMVKKVFEHLGFDQNDQRLASLLVGNHSVYHRLLTGSDSYAGLIEEINKVKGSNSLESVLASIAMMCVADDAGISQEGFLTLRRLKSIIDVVTKPQINFVDRDEPVLEDSDVKEILLRISRQLDYKLRKKEVRAVLIDLEPLLLDVVKKDKEFKSFMLRTFFFYTRFAIQYMNAQALLNFYYLAYKYVQAVSINEIPWVDLAWEKEVSATQARILNEKLSKVKLWEEPLLSTSNPDPNNVIKVALQYSINLESAFENPSQKIIMRILTQEPKEPKASIEKSEAKYQRDIPKGFVRGYRRLLSNEEEILEQIGLNKDSIIIYTTQGRTLNAEFISLFKDVLKNQQGQKIVIDLDDEVIFIEGLAIYYTYENKVYKIEIKEIKELVEKFYYGNSETNLDEIRLILGDLIATDKFKKQAKLACVNLILPQLESSLKNVSFIHTFMISRFRERFMPTFGVYAHILTAGQILPVSWPIPSKKSEKKRSPEKLPYPVSLTSSSNRDTLSVPSSLETLLSELKAKFDIGYALTDRSGKPVAFYNTTTKKVEIDRGLVVVAPVFGIQEIIDNQDKDLNT
ncbi:MAG: (d)CMP kinase, partial [Candidatus Omnitrophica bacterium]|nr:(d)CMP kinase [Candidatus Omnitrophota bacterium]